MVVAAESGVMADRGDPYQRGVPSAAVPCGADPSAADSSGDLRDDSSTPRDGLVAAAMPHGHVLAAAADRTTNENGNDDDGGHPSSNRNRTPRNSCSRTETGSSSAAAMVAASDVPSAVATVTCGHHLHGGQVAVAIPSGVPREICDGIPVA